MSIFLLITTKGERATTKSVDNQISSQPSALSCRRGPAKPHSLTPPKVITSSCMTLVCYSASPDLRAALNLSTAGSTPPISTRSPNSNRVNISSTAIPRRIQFHTMNTQTLDGRYVDREKLVTLLKDLFGAGSFQIKVRNSFQRSFESSSQSFCL